jgi:peptide/nickel transport system substrate-binding protein
LTVRRSGPCYRRHRETGSNPADARTDDRALTPVPEAEDAPNPLTRDGGSVVIGVDHQWSGSRPESWRHHAGGQSDWNCTLGAWINHQKKPFDDARVRRALTLAIDRWGSAPGLSKVSLMSTVGSLTFPTSPLAPNKDELSDIAGFWPDIEKSRAEAKRLLKEAGAEGLIFVLMNRNVDQPYKYLGTWLIDQWSKIGLNVTQQVVPTGPWFETLRSGNFAVSTGGSCHGIVNPVIDVETWLPRSVNEANYGYYEDPKELDIYEKMLHETDLAKQQILMYQFNKDVLDEQAHYIQTFWWNRLVPLRSYVHGWKIGPSHYSNQDLGTIWLSAPECGNCGAHPTMTKSEAGTDK